MTGKDQLPVFFTNLDFFGGSAITKDVIFPFSTSAVLMGGDPGISSNRVLVLRVDRRCEWISFGKVDLRGVSAVATLRADFRMLARISHDRFFAKYHSTAEAA